MATLSTIAKLPRPEFGDPPSGPGAFISLTNALDLIVIPRYASSAARDAAIPSPTSGQHAWLSDSNSLTVYNANAAAWVSYNVADQTSTGLTAATGFSMSGGSFLGKKVNGVCTVSGFISVTADVTPAGANITPDKRMADLPVGYRPPVQMSFNYDNGTNGGDGIINPDGSVFIRTASGLIATGTSIRFSCTYVL